MTSNSPNSRRRFLKRSIVATGSGLLMARTVFADSTEMIATPSQTLGPYYPIPAIENQKHYDADLTKLSADGDVADGDQIVVAGTVVDLEGKPIIGTIVEIWQANAEGHYNHPKDNRSKIDPRFQYWGRLTVDDQASFVFRTIKPGKYPGRTPHIHYRVLAPQRKELVTQMYFNAFDEFNNRDGIYRELTKAQQKSVTVALEKSKEHEGAEAGKFQIVLGPTTDKKSTPPM